MSQNQNVFLYKNNCLKFLHSEMKSLSKKPLYSVTAITVFLIINFRNEDAIECVHMTSQWPCGRSNRRNSSHGGVKYYFGD